ncbi:MAG: cell division protein FtsZ [Candidatus Kerfeldbacteria bacterium RIFCSPHIGHO2_02_FULL_42_14]|uniref:Cell division protein FtsZ n=1 Tax=Candidatus Kerfeldbacteria bacterium RIFCSPHIGHO2_02_FULL_42_14 TaxID=1798540 RepID=A0A1G2ARD1_9BACT|nr:MAG: cell division protein FtsZ [Candidatus Kerfeldbacteria bacterium RIFCSPHIGHO2_02_FULL_42_14]OGY81341.1 MAG: cell division protein FtsZ [Candidatus Kerfeldbacteria bacterium RIFCSPHIGHO2_12_FULL_42_13]OGY83626.1 MAG: cell division protein FtsZ [Candidatus Kerfeldbacteria bacterium RIFCSPLOWO2_02_FULL_42_19]OGY85799.1 MAG: cell division protein FtsZ [Candidatus Kerfeldbacteria bacterium RIFCSPLOWO2_12_FULL_43_9]
MSQNNGRSHNNKPTEVKPEIETFAKIKVLGAGGAGCAAINRMVEAQIKGIELIAVNTDSQSLHHSKAPVRVHIGQNTSRGLGAGMDPDVGRRAAEENIEDIEKILKGADMVFLTAGFGGGTGSGSLPVIAELARDLGALTVSIVTKPFAFEGEQRKAIAENAFTELQSKVDTIITIPNDRLLQIIDKKTSLLDAFKIVDDVLRQGVQGISDLITLPGLINVDFADVKSVMENAGSALMGIGTASGENRAVEAAKAAIDSPLLEMSIDGAKGILFTISGSSNLGMYEVNEAARVITETTDPNARIIFGSVIDDSLQDEIKITVVATGFGPQGKQATRKVKPAVKSPFSSKIKIEEAEPLSKDAGGFRRQTVGKEETIEARPITHETKPTKLEEDLEIPTFIRKKMM